MQLAARDAVVDHLGEPLAHPLVQPRAGRPQRLVTRGAQPQLDPQHEVVAHRAGLREALLDHRRQPLGGARLVGSGHLDARVPRALVGVLERLRQERLARLEVVVDRRRGDARIRRDPRDPGVVDPLAGDPPHRGVQDPLACARHPPTLRPSTR